MHLFPNIKHTERDLALAMVSYIVPRILNMSKEGSRFNDACILGEDEHSDSAELCADVDYDQGRKCHSGPQWEAGFRASYDIVDFEQLGDGSKPDMPSSVGVPILRLPHPVTVHWKRVLRLAERFAFSDPVCASSFHGGPVSMLDAVQPFDRWVKFEAMRKCCGGRHVNCVDGDFKSDMKMDGSSCSSVGFACQELWICLKLAPQDQPFVDKTC